jgi:hypothetical protein
MTPPCAWSSPLQRAFTSFPSGGVGTALLTLRFFAGLIAAFEAVSAVRAAPSIMAISLALPAMFAGLALLPGVLMPAASAILAIEGIFILCGPGAQNLALLDSPIALLEFAVMTASMTVLGPGAASIDARLFGRREIPIGDGRRPPDL